MDTCRLNPLTRSLVVAVALSGIAACGGSSEDPGAASTGASSGADDGRDSEGQGGGDRGGPEPDWPAPPASTFNGLALPADASWDEYSFAILGHLRAGPQDPSPNRRMRDHTDRLMASDPALIVSLGDMYYSISEQRLADFRAWVQGEVTVPFFNAVGNHDIQIGGDRLPDGSLDSRIYDSQAYSNEFGPTWFEFRLGSELFVFLDFESAGAFRMDDEQQAWFDGVLERAARDPRLRNVFLFMHKVVWSYHDPDMAPLFRFRHPVPIAADYSWYADELEPRLAALPAELDVYLFAGDIGGGNQHLQVYHRADGRFTYVAAGMGARDRDGFVDVQVAGGEITMDYVTLRSGDVVPIAAFGNEFWERFYADNPELAEKATFPKPESR